MAQGNVLTDFSRPGPAREREAYYAGVRSEMNNMLGRFKNAWERDNATELSKLYTDAASYLAPGERPVQTRGKIREYFAGFLARVGAVQMQMNDFGTSGDLAYVTWQLTFYMEMPEGPPRYIVRTDLLVLRRSMNAWRIETHMAREEPEAKTAP